MVSAGATAGASGALVLAGLAGLVVLAGRGAEDPMPVAVAGGVSWRATGVEIPWHGHDGSLKISAGEARPAHRPLGHGPWVAGMPHGVELKTVEVRDPRDNQLLLSAPAAELTAAHLRLRAPVAADGRALGAAMVIAGSAAPAAAVQAVPGQQR
jgi:hypothetical protein